MRKRSPFGHWKPIGHIPVVKHDVHKSGRAGAGLGMDQMLRSRFNPHQVVHGAADKRVVNPCKMRPERVDHGTGPRLPPRARSGTTPPPVPRAFPRPSAATVTAPSFPCPIRRKASAVPRRPCRRRRRRPGGRTSRQRREVSGKARGGRVDDEVEPVRPATRAERHRADRPLFLRIAARARRRAPRSGWRSASRSGAVRRATARSLHAPRRRRRAGAPTRPLTSDREIARQVPHEP